MREPERIVSLLASGTELVCRLGLGDRLVGRSHECDFPDWVRRLPEVSRPAFPIAGSSLEIDRLVRERLHSGQPLYVVDDALLLELRPDLLITQTHCEVCAVSPADLAHQRPSELSRRPIVALGGASLAEIVDGFVQVAAALGRRQAGLALVAELEGEVTRVREQVRGLPAPSVVCLEWIEPPFAMGNWGPELVAAAGGRSLLGEPGTHSRTTTLVEVAERDPDVLVVAPCGFGLERAGAELSAQHAYRELRAVREGRAYVADGNLYFNRSSPSLFSTPQLLAEMLHPERFPPAHERVAWSHWPAPG